MKTVISLPFFGLGVFWIIQLNPIYIYNMSEASGYGYGMIRALLYTSGISILLLIVAYHYLLGKTGRGLSKQVLTSVLPLMMLTIFSTLLNLFRDDFDIIGVFPLVEFFISALVFSLFKVRKWIECNFTMIVKVIVFFMVMDILFWIYSYVTGVHYGVFRAYVNGITINRMADLFLVPAATYLLSANRVGLTIKIISLVFIGLTFYRTAYLAALVTLAFIFWKERDHSLRRFFKLGVYISVIVFLGYLYSLYSESYSNVQKLVFERLVSTFTVESEEEWSQSSRIDQVPIIFNYIANNPLDLIIGAGSGAVIDENKIYNYFNYPLIMMIMYGIFTPLLFLFLLLKLFRVALRAGGGSADIFVLSFVVYFLVVINIFPYMTYFPVMSVFAFFLVYFVQRPTEKIVEG
jgi:hypothetical protein